MQKKTCTWLFIIISVLLFAYTAYRAAHVSMVYDEAVSYLDFANISVRSIFEYPYLTANNHVLNSLLMHWALFFGPPGDFLLRSPNLLAHIMFMVCSWYLFAGFADVRIRLCAFVFINCNPFLLDYFSMARGYGLSLGLMMASLLFFKKYVENRTSAWVTFQFLSLLCCGLAVLASFTLLTFYLVLCMMILAWNLHRVFRHYIPVKNLMICLACIAVVSYPLLSYVIRKLIHLKEAKELYFGGSDSFWHDTVERFFNLVFYYKPHPAYFDRFLTWSSVVVPLVSLLLFLYNVVRNKNAVLEKHFVFWAVLGMLLICAGISVFQHYALHVPYLTERTALFLLVLFGLTAVFLLDYISQYQKNTVLLTALLFGAASLANMIISMNFTSFLLFKDQSKAAMQLIENDYAANPVPPNKTVSVLWVFSPSVEYYHRIHHDNWLVVDGTGKDSTADYFIGGMQDIPKFKPGAYRVLATYPLAGSALLKKIDGPGNPYEKEK